MTSVEAYWTEHTVNSVPFISAAESLAYLEQRSADYPLFHDLMDLWGDHSRDTVLDYGCGPGNDLVGFLAHGTKRVIGMDVSVTSLDLARQRLGLHGFTPELVKVSDDVPTIPLPTGSVDYIHCLGVLHHVSNPSAILSEFHRVLHPGGTAMVMVYNRESLWFHLYIAYEHQVRQGLDADLTAGEAFLRVADGGAPIAFPYRPDQFVALCETAGFRTEYRGGYYAQGQELDLWRAFGQDAIADRRLGDEHRAFLASLTGDPPLHDGLPTGLGGVYRLSR